MVLLEGASAYADGVVLRLVIHAREAGREARRRLFAHLELAHGRGMLDARLRPGGLRWGVEFSDGRRVGTLDESPWANDPPDGVDFESWLPDHPVLEWLDRPTGTGGTWSREAWLWPHPPAGVLRVVCAWADRDITETSVFIDVAPLREAAQRAKSIWA